MAQRTLLELPKRFNVIVKPNKNKTSITAYEPTTNTYTITVAAPPDKNKANKELIRFLSKQCKKKVSIVAGFTSSHKICETERFSHHPKLFRKNTIST